MINMLEDKYIGLALAITSTLAIGTSFVITKKGLNDAADKHGFEGEGFAYLKTPLWWAGIASLVVGEVANFAAYAFAPAILVTPLGALSVLIGAVLGAYFLNEELGVLGKLGCAICLLGSVIIVLHAPPDQEIETVDQILNFAIKPGKKADETEFGAWKPRTNSERCRLRNLLSGGHSLLDCHDLQGGASVRQEEPTHLYFDMLDGGINIGHVGQGIRHRLEADICWKQSVFASIDLCVHDCDDSLHLDADELLQQGFEPVRDFNRESSVLCHLYPRHVVRFFYPVPWVQHYRCRQHDFAPVRILGHFCRCLSAQPLPRRPGWTSDAQWQDL